MSRISARLKVSRDLKQRRRINRITEVEIHRVCLMFRKEFNLIEVQVHLGSGGNYPHWLST